MTFYLYKNTINGSKIVEEFDTESSALERMECLALNCLDNNVTGFAVRTDKLIAEYEV